MAPLCADLVSRRGPQTNLWTALRVVHTPHGCGPSRALPSAPERAAMNPSECHGVAVRKGQQRSPRRPVRRCCCPQGSTTMHSPECHDVAGLRGQQRHTRQPVPQCCWPQGSTTKHSPECHDVAGLRGQQRSTRQPVPQCCCPQRSTTKHSPTSAAMLLPTKVNNDALARVPRRCCPQGSTTKHSPTSAAMLLSARVNNDALARVSPSPKTMWGAQHRKCENRTIAYRRKRRATCSTTAGSSFHIGSSGRGSCRTRSVKPSPSHQS
jgi:hypothetical protein